MSFQQPRENNGAPMDELVGSLLIFKVLAYRTGLNTSFGNDKDAVEADIHCLDGKHAGEIFKGAYVFQGALIGSLKGAVGDADPILGRLGQGEAKPKQNPPYILLPFTAADAAIAGPYWDRVVAGQFQAPAQQAAAPAPQPAAAPAAPAAASPSPAAASPATANPAAAVPPGIEQLLPAGTTLATFSTLPPQVQAVLIPDDATRALLAQYTAA